MTTIPLTKAVELLRACHAVHIAGHRPAVPSIYDRINPEDDEETFMDVDFGSTADKPADFYFLFDDNHKVVLDGNTMHLIERESGDVVALALLVPMPLQVMSFEHPNGVYAADGITIATLKKVLAGYPDTNNAGEDNEVWLGTGRAVSSPCVKLSGLNVRVADNGADLILRPDEKCWESAHITEPAHTIEDSYIQEFWWMQKVMGSLADVLLVNAHKHNAITPAQCGLILDQMIARVAQFRKRYTEQWKSNNFNIQR